MQTFPNTKIYNALHENNFAQKIKNSLPCAAARWVPSLSRTKLQRNV